jgi:hypothetical protein
VICARFDWRPGGRGCQRAIAGTGPWLCLAVLAQLLAGCAIAELSKLGRPTGTPIDLPPAALPSYQAGSWFLFDDGQLERVREAAGDTVTWSQGGGSTELRYRNPVLPRLAWNQPGSRGKASLTAPADALWPLEPGSSVRFVERRSVVDKEDGTSRRVERQWRCTVAKPVRLAPRVGRFDTFPIDCTRNSSSRAMRPLESHRWYFAPAVGHYVRHEHRRSGRPREVRDLIARGDRDGPWLALDPALSAAIGGALEQAGPTGAAPAPGDGDTLPVNVGAAWQLATGQPCRDYAVATHAGTVEGAACRDRAGRWQPLGEERSRIDG